MGILSLQALTGLDISLDPKTFELRFGAGIIVGKKSVRNWEAMKEFVEEPDARPTRNEIYVIFRNIARPEDAKAMDLTHIRYDITVIPPGVFAEKSSEYFRTAGHYHPFKEGVSVAYPEVYEVLHGRGYFLLQHPAPDNPAILAEVYVVEAGPGEKVMMPPGFGHVSVNAGNETLVLSNWIADTFQYDYEPYKTFKGGGYWLREGLVPDTIEFEKNHNYAEVPEIKKLRPKELPEFGLVRKEPMYELAHELKKLAFLTSPENYQKNLTIEHCFREL